MKLVICAKFQVNRMNCVKSRRGAGPIDPPPPRLRVTIFSRRLLGLSMLNMISIQFLQSLSRKRTSDRRKYSAEEIMYTIPVEQIRYSYLIQRFSSFYYSLKRNLEVKRNEGHGYNNPAFIAMDEGTENHHYDPAEKHHPSDLNEIEMDCEANLIIADGQPNPSVLSFENILALQENTDSGC